MSPTVEPENSQKILCIESTVVNNHRRRRLRQMRIRLNFILKVSTLFFTIKSPLKTKHGLLVLIYVRSLNIKRFILRARRKARVLVS